jgi:OOP family OmpA-OmpF porin
MKTGIVISALLLGLGLQAQPLNLIPNPSFEIFYKNSEDKGADMLRLWYIPTKTSSDYFNSKKKELKNESEDLEARTGNGYAGVIACDKRPDFREYISIKLTEPLKRDHIYEVVYYTRLSANSGLATDAVGAAITTADLMDDNKRDAFPYAPQVTTNGTFDNASEWIEVKGEFAADGGEQFITIGNFKDDASMRRDPASGGNPKLSYYYFDDVSLVFTGRVREREKERHKVRSVNLGEPEPAEIEEGETVVLDRIYFETGKAVLKADSFEELDALAVELLKLGEFKVQIFGHTDNVGNPKLNMQLSENRAKAVAEYLVSKGVDPGRLVHKGIGSADPKHDNSTAEGREKNRRVEFTLHH